MDDRLQNRALRLLVLLEGTNVTGPARNVFELCRVAPALADPPLSVFLTSFLRSPNQPDETSGIELLAAAATAGLGIAPVRERFAFDPAVLRALRETVQRIRPDVIETHHVKSHFLVRLSGIWRNCPWIAFHHGYTRDARRTLLYNQLDRWSLQAPSRIVTVCEPFRRQLVARGIPASRICVVHNAISVDWIGRDGIAAKEVLPEHCRRRNGSEKIVLAVGRLSAEKAFADLLAAMAEMRRLYPAIPTRLLIAGEGPERASLERQIQRMQLQDRVLLLGHVRDPRPLYRTADAVAISSISEGSPNVLLEALAAGVPTVTTAVGGVPEIVEDKQSALLVPAGDPAAMAWALGLLFSDAELNRRIALAGRELIASRYSPESRARVLLQTYESVRREWKPRA